MTTDEFNADNNPLHVAVIDNDVETVLSLHNDHNLLSGHNNFGITPLELAQLLDRQQCIFLLQEDHIATPAIRILLCGARTIVKLTPQELFSTIGVTWKSFPYFNSYEELCTATKKCPWTLSKSWLGSDNRALGQRLRCRLSRGYAIDITIAWIDEEMGYGVITNHDIAEGNYVGEYSGIIRPLNRADSNPYCMLYPTCWWSWHPLAIDAAASGNATRFLNHSLIPNLQPTCLVVGSFLRMAFFAKRHIQRGEQLTFDYGKGYRFF